MYGNCNFIEIPPPVPHSDLTVCVEEKVFDNASSPEVWGEAFWFILHLGSSKASRQISPEDARLYWGFIEGIPLMLPCRNCSKHAAQFIQESRARRGAICASRDSLVQFFVDFHNKVNERSGKPAISVAEVERMFSGGARLKRIHYY